MTIDMTKITEILNTAGHELRDYTAMTEVDLATLRCEADKRHEAGMAIQKQIKRDLNALYLRYAETFCR